MPGPPPRKKPLPLEEIHRQMLASGLLTSLPDPALDLDDDDPDDRRSPSRESRCPKPSSASGAEVPALYFCDSSALVKRYVQEVGTPWIRGLTRRSPSTVIDIARITAVEVTCAVARRRKGKTLTPRRASSILYRFRQHLAGRYSVAEVTLPLLENAMRLGNTHALRL